MLPRRGLREDLGGKAPGRSDKVMGEKRLSNAKREDEKTGLLLHKSRKRRRLTVKLIRETLSFGVYREGDGGHSRQGNVEILS